MRKQEKSCKPTKSKNIIATWKRTSQFYIKGDKKILPQQVPITENTPMGKQEILANPQKSKKLYCKLESKDLDLDHRLLDNYRKQPYEKTNKSCKSTKNVRKIIAKCNQTSKFNIEVVKKITPTRDSTTT